MSEGEFNITKVSATGNLFKDSVIYPANYKVETQCIKWFP